MGVSTKIISRLAHLIAQLQQPRGASRPARSPELMPGAIRETLHVHVRPGLLGAHDVQAGHVAQAGVGVRLRAVNIFQNACCWNTISPVRRAACA
jgi:hypothetical protein